MTSPTATRTHPEGSRRLLRLLTPREAQVLARFTVGDDVEAIARTLGIPPGTARVHLHRAMRKLGVRTRSEAAAAVTAHRPAAPPHAVETAPAHPVPVPAPVPIAVPVRPVRFADLLATAHTRLVQQTFLLTARPRRAAHCVHRALATAARYEVQVSATADPEAWVRAYAFEVALSPWRRGGPRRAHRWHLPRRRIRVPPADRRLRPDHDRLTPRDRALLRALRRLSRPQRRALVLHDALGLGVGAVAVEVESSTAAAEGRVRAARAALARSVPDLVGPDPDAPDFGDRLSALLHRAAVRGCPSPRQPSLPLLKAVDRLRSGLVTGAAALLTLAMGAAVVGTLLGSGPSDYFHPQVPPVPSPLCSWADTGSAGPQAPGGQPGLRSPWCSPTPGQPAEVVAPPPTRRPEAGPVWLPARSAEPAALPQLPVAVPRPPCPTLRLCPAGAPAAMPFPVL